MILPTGALQTAERPAAPPPRGMWSLYRREVLRFLRWAVMALLSPAVTSALYLLVFSVAVEGGLAIGDLAFAEFVAPGLIFMALATWSYSGPAYALMIAKMDKYIEDELMAPLSSLEIVAAHLGAALTVGMMAAATVTLATLPFASFRVLDPVGLIVHAVAGGLLMGTIGMLAALISQKWDQLAVVSELALTPLIMLSCVFYSLDALPEALRPAMAWNPIFASINGFRAALTGHVDMPLEQGATPLLLWLAVGLVACYAVMRSGYKLKS